MWVATTESSDDDLLGVDRFLHSVTQDMATMEGIAWATHDFDRESVCFSVMVDGWVEGRDSGLAAARLVARNCLRQCLANAGAIGGTHRTGAATTPSPIRLRLDTTPLRLRTFSASLPAREALN